MPQAFLDQTSSSTEASISLHPHLKDYPVISHYVFGRYNLDATCTAGCGVGNKISSAWTTFFDQQNTSSPYLITQSVPNSYLTTARGLSNSDAKTTSFFFLLLPAGLDRVDRLHSWKALGSKRWSSVRLQCMLSCTYNGGVESDCECQRRAETRRPISAPSG
jgi:hypothetical protein